MNSKDIFLILSVYVLDMRRATFVLYALTLLYCPTASAATKGSPAPTCEVLFNTLSNDLVQQISHWPDVRWPLTSEKIKQIQAFAHLALDLPPERKMQQNAWSPENFSDPRAHDSSNFQYLVHGVRDEYLDGRTRERDLLKSAQIVAAPESTIFKNISLSIISNSNHGTVYPSGFILQVPKENMIAAREGLIGVQNVWAITSKEKFKDYQDYINRIINAVPLEAPAEVLNKSRGANEVIAVRTGIKITGIFVREPEFKEDFVRLEIAQRAATELGLPLIILPNRN